VDLITVSSSDHHTAAPDRDMSAFAPGASSHHAPTSIAEMAESYRAFDADRTTTIVVGGGRHLGIGNAVLADVSVSTERLDSIIDHQPEDLTLTVEAGVTLGEIDALLEPHRQTAALPETEPDATIGGVVAAGISGYRRNRFGPTRDRVLEVTVVTGDGRVVTGGARVVKNVSGYDLPRLATGSFGALGVIVSVCLKLWPEPEARATVRLDDASDADRVHRPMAILETDEGAWAYLQGPAAEVASTSTIGAIQADDFTWPGFDEPGTAEMRVPPSLVPKAIERLDVPFIAQHGVGVVAIASEDPDVLLPARSWCESVGGSLVLTSHSGPVDAAPPIDPWGTPPTALSLQRRLIAGFDPHRVINRGRLPGGI
jgi:glycolate oxidase FAD binding subunit